MAYDASSVAFPIQCVISILPPILMEEYLIINPDPTTVDYEVNTLAVLTDDETLYIGIDTGKESHHAGLTSKSLLAKHKRFDKCPVTNFPNSREGFEALLAAIQVYAPLDRCIVLKERTGHYGHALGEYLQKQGITCYTMHVYKRGLKNKTDKRDALNLANTAYSQLELGLQPGDSMKQIRHEEPPSEAARKLHVLVQRKAELTVDTTVRRNRLTSICDEVFPELTEIFKDPNNTGGLNLRLKFPTPALVALASIDDLLATRAHTRPSRADYIKLQELAKQSIGITDAARLYGLTLEQSQLIGELREMQKHSDVLEAEIEKIVLESREGKILMSTGFFAAGGAAAVVATIGTVARFENPGKLRAFAGWSPNQTQTGTSKDAMALSKGGNKILKQAIFFAAFQAIREDTELKAKYDKLVVRKCNLDLRTGKYVGKMKCVGRIAGDIITLIYVLLKKDYDLLQSLSPGQEPPEPTLYDRDLHRKHRLRGKDEEPVARLEAPGEPGKGDRIRQLLKENPGLKVSELVKLTGSSRSATSRIRKEWVEQMMLNKQPAEAVKK
jgi:transposase